MELEKQWNNSQTKIFKKDLLSIFPEAEEYVRERLRDLQEYNQSLVSTLKERIKEIHLKYEDDFLKWFLVELVKISGKAKSLEYTEKQIRTLKMYIPSNNPDRITDADIEVAKTYPIIEILGVQSDRRNIKCPSQEHKDKKPSCEIKNNFAYCHSCGKSWDSIQLLMDLRGFSFIEAVKQLRN